MVNAVSAGFARAAAPSPAHDPVALAARIVRDNMQNGRPNLPEIKRDLDAVKAQDSDLGAAVGRHVEAGLTHVQRGQLAAATYAARAPDGDVVVFADKAPSVADHRAQAAGTPGRAFYDRLDRVFGDGRPASDDTPKIEAGLRRMQAEGLTLANVETARSASGASASAPGATTAEKVRLAADLTQMGLDLAGIVDPTGVADGGNAVISAGRAIGSLFGGEFKEAAGHLGNGVISVAGIVPILGDPAKIGKIGKWAQTVSDAVGAVAHNPALRATFQPALREIADAVNKIPQGAIDKLPQSARESIKRMKTQLDEFFGRAEPRPGSVKPDFIPSTTKPTGEVGGAPGGKRATTEPNSGSEKKRGIDRENESADNLSQQGYKVEQQPTLTLGDRTRQGIGSSKNPDYRIEGRVFDNYAPTSRTAQGVYEGMATKVSAGQTHCIVLNLKNTHVRPADVLKMIADHPIKDLQEIIVIDKLGSVRKSFP